MDPRRSRHHQEFDLTLLHQVPGDEVIHVGALPALLKPDYGGPPSKGLAEFVFDVGDIDGRSQQRTATEQNVHIGMFFENLLTDVMESSRALGDTAVDAFFRNSTSPMKRDGEGEKKC